MARWAQDELGTCAPDHLSKEAMDSALKIDPREDLVAIYCTQLLNGGPGLRGEFVTLLYQSLIGK